MNIIDTITLAGTLILALPIGMLGVEFLVTGRPVVGVGFVAVAVALVLGQHYLEPDVKGRIAGGIVDRVVPDEEVAEEPADASKPSADAPSEPVDIPSATGDAQQASADAQAATGDEEVSSAHAQSTTDDEEARRT